MGKRVGGLGKLINLYLGDCMGAMSKMKDKQYDLAIVDPPYSEECNLKGGLSRHGTHGWKTFSDKIDEWNVAPSPKYFGELRRVSKNQIIWGGNYFVLPPSQGWIFWDKGQRDFSLADGELAWTSFDRALRVFTLSRAVSTFSDAKFHPTQKPVALYKWLLSKYAKPGQTILDTHLGSGSIAIACHDLGYSLDGWELDHDYYRDALARFNLHKSQGTLFDPVEITKPTERELF